MLAALLLNPHKRGGDDKIIRGGDDKLRRRKSEGQYQREHEVRLQQTLRGLVQAGKDERKRKRLYAELAVILMEMGELD